MQGLSWAYGKPQLPEHADKVFDKAVALGCNLIDTAWIYSTPGQLHSEELIARAIARHGRSALIISDKIGVRLDKNPPFVQSEAELRSQLDDSLRRLGTDHVDVLFLNRPSPTIPIEKTMVR